MQRLNSCLRELLVRWKSRNINRIVSVGTQGKTDKWSSHSMADSPEIIPASSWKIRDFSAAFYGFLPNFNVSEVGLTPGHALVSELSFPVSSIGGQTLRVEVVKEQLGDDQTRHRVSLAEIATERNQANHSCDHNSGCSFLAEFRTRLRDLIHSLEMTSPTRVTCF